MAKVKLKGCRYYSMFFAEMNSIPANAPGISGRLQIGTAPVSTYFLRAREAGLS